MAYIIQFEGREKEEVLREGNTVRIDTTNLFLDNVVELFDWEYTVTKGHNYSVNGETWTVYYIILDKKIAVNKYTGKRFVTKNSYDLGIENEIFDDEKNKYIPFWYILDKAVGKELANYEDAGEGARQSMKRHCDRLNEMLIKRKGISH